MLRQCLLAAVFTLPSVATLAEDEEQSYSWCRGYAVQALGALPVAGLSRTDLWLAWNETVQYTIINGELNEAEYTAGREKFSRQLAANNVAAMIETSDENCDLGRNSLWVWW